MKIAELEKKIKERVPDFEIKFKDESKFMKFLGKIMFFNKSFMTNYVTTIGTKVYFPSRAQFEINPDRYFVVLAHEYVHVLDYVRSPVKFVIGFLFPQILSLLAIFSLLAVINPYFLLFLLFLLLAAPLPSPTRTSLEMRGYQMSLKTENWLTGTISDSSFVWVAKQFTGPGYYFMCPYGDYVDQRLRSFKNDNTCLTDRNQAYYDVYELLKCNNMI